MEKELDLNGSMVTLISMVKYMADGGRGMIDVSFRSEFVVREMARCAGRASRFRNFGSRFVLYDPKTQRLSF